MICKFGHTFEWNDDWGCWMCEDCGKLGGTNALIAPCVTCGKDVDADEVYCQECLGVSDEQDNQS